MNPNRHLKQRRGRLFQRGNNGAIALVATVFLAFGLIIIGLAVDAGLLYLVRAKLGAAADAASLAAARSLNLSLTVGQQNGDAVTRGKAFFNANFPADYLGTTSSSVDVSLTQGATPSTLNTLYVTANAQTNAPVYFMRLLNYTTIPVTARSQAARRDINLILVLDQSSSMNTVQAGTGQNSCDVMKTAASSFVDYFSNTRDRVGVISFDASYKLDFAPSQNFNPAAKNAIKNISCGGNTGTANALNQAYQQLKTINEPSALNVIVLFTDGQPNGVTADYPVKMKTDTRYGDGYGSYGSTSTLYSMPPSACKDSAGRTYTSPLWNPFKAGDPGAGAADNTMRGVIAEWNGGPASTGTVAGVFYYISNQNSIVAASSGCSFASTAAEERRDVAYIPAQDIYGNATIGYKTNFVEQTGGYGGNDYFTSGPYAGRLRSDSPSALTNASFNAADDQGTKIRSDVTYGPAIYTIGLGGNDKYGADAEFLMRLANVPTGIDSKGNPVTNAIYDPNRPRGLYAYAPSSTQLGEAFTIIASSVLRLSQ